MARTLHEQLGGNFAIAAVVDHFSDALIANPKVGKNSPNPQLRDWHRNSLDRLPGLKFMRTLWVIDVTGGPVKYVGTRPGKTRLGLEEAHRKLKITSEEFDEVAAVLAKSLDHFKVPKDAKTKVLEAFAAHKGEVTAGATGKPAAAGNSQKEDEKKMAGAYGKASDEKKFMAEMDLKTLIEAERIKKDSARYKAAMACHKEHTKALASVEADQKA